MVWDLLHVFDGKEHFLKIVVKFILQHTLHIQKSVRIDRYFDTSKAMCFFSNTSIFSNCIIESVHIPLHIPLIG